MIAICVIEEARALIALGTNPITVTLAGTGGRVKLSMLTIVLGNATLLAIMTGIKPWTGAIARRSRHSIVLALNGAYTIAVVRAWNVIRTAIAFADICKNITGRTAGDGAVIASYAGPVASTVARAGSKVT